MVPAAGCLPPPACCSATWLQLALAAAGACCCCLASADAVTCLQPDRLPFYLQVQLYMVAFTDLSCSMSVDPLWLHSCVVCPFSSATRFMFVFVVSVLPLGPHGNLLYVVFACFFVAWLCLDCVGSHVVITLVDHTATSFLFGGVPTCQACSVH